MFSLVRRWFIRWAGAPQVLPAGAGAIASDAAVTEAVAGSRAVTEAVGTDVAVAAATTVDRREE